MQFKNWLFTEEIYPQNKTATVFHRTFKELVDSVMTSDFKSGAGKGCMYGCGLYTTFALESQFTDYMQSAYGNYVIKFKVTDLQNYLICPFMVATSILGQNPDQYSLLSQFKKFGLYDEAAKKYSPEQLQNIDNSMRDQYTSDLARNLVQDIPSIQTKTKGILYRGSKDGYCLVKYPPIEDGTITMLAYADAPVYDKSVLPNLKRGNGWITSTDKAAVKSIYQAPRDKAQNYLDDDSFAKFLTKINTVPPAEAKSMIQNLNPNKVQVFSLLQNSKNIFVMAKLLGPEKMKLLDWNMIKPILAKIDKPASFLSLIDPAILSTLEYKTLEFFVDYMDKRYKNGQIDKKEFENFYLQLLPYMAQNKNQLDLLQDIVYWDLKEITPPEYFKSISEQLNSLSDEDLYYYLDKIRWPNFVSDMLNNEKLAGMADWISFSEDFHNMKLINKIHWMKKLLPHMHSGQIGKNLLLSVHDQQFIDTFKNYLNDPSAIMKIIQDTLSGFGDGSSLIPQMNDQALMTAINKLTFNNYEPEKLNALLNAIKSPEVAELLRSKIQSSQNNVTPQPSQPPQQKPQGFMSKLKGLFGGG
jgi:Ca2+-binding EF-hand superfamily protein